MRQSIKASTETGSLINYLMGNNQSIPEVGKGATVLGWTDRHAYEVIEVSKDLKKVVIQRYDAERVDHLGMSESQEYKYEKLTDEKIYLVWRNNAWRSESYEICFTKEYIDNCPYKFALAMGLTEEQLQEVYQGEAFPQKVVEGITKERKVFNKINIVFGVKNEYFDYSF